MNCDIVFIHEWSSQFKKSAISVEHNSVVKCVPNPKYTWAPEEIQSFRFRAGIIQIIIPIG